MVLSVVDEYTLGHAMRVLLIPDEHAFAEAVERVLRAVDPAEFPHVAGVNLRTVLGPREGAFETGLEALLDGFERTLLAGRA